MAALRVMEVRQAYACESFEWDQLRRIAERDGQAANVSLLRGRVRPQADVFVCDKLCLRTPIACHVGCEAKSVSACCPWADAGFPSVHKQPQVSSTARPVTSWPSAPVCLLPRRRRRSCARERRAQATAAQAVAELQRRGYASPCCTAILLTELAPLLGIELSSASEGIDRS